MAAASAERVLRTFRVEEIEFIHKDDMNIPTPLGIGGQGSVYLVRRTDADGEFIAKRYTAAGEVAERKLMEEVTLLSNQINMPNIIRTYGILNATSSKYIIMDYKKAGSLGDALKRWSERRKGPIEGLPPRAAVCFARSIAFGLKQLHSIGGGGIYTHNDVKPDNLLLDEEWNMSSSADPPRLILTDFGCMRDNVAPDSLTTTRGALGTWQYMAPENMDILELKDHRHKPPADVFSIGCTLLHMLRGLPPWPQTYDSSTIKSRIVDMYMKHEGSKPCPPFFGSDAEADADSSALRRGALEVARRCTLMDPSKRMTVPEVIAALTALLDGAKPDLVLPAAPSLAAASSETDTSAAGSIPGSDDIAGEPSAMSFGAASRASSSSTPSPAPSPVAAPEAAAVSKCFEHIHITTAYVDAGREEDAIESFQQVEELTQKFGAAIARNDALFSGLLKLLGTTRSRSSLQLPWNLCINLAAEHRDITDALSIGALRLFLDTQRGAIAKHQSPQEMPPALITVLEARDRANPEAVSKLKLVKAMWFAHSAAIISSGVSLKSLAAAQGALHEAERLNAECGGAVTEFVAESRQAIQKRFPSLNTVKPVSTSMTAPAYVYSRTSRTTASAATAPSGVSSHRGTPVSRSSSEGSIHPPSFTSADPGPTAHSAASPHAAPAAHARPVLHHHSSSPSSPSTHAHTPMPGFEALPSRPPAYSGSFSPPAGYPGYPPMPHAVGVAHPVAPAAAHTDAWAFSWPFASPGRPRPSTGFIPPAHSYYPQQPPPRPPPPGWP